MRNVTLHWKVVTLASLIFMFGEVDAMAAKKNVMCAKTNTGHYFPLARISMMVVPDGGSTFEIVLKDGKGEAGVKSISFEKHLEEIDLALYQSDASGYAMPDMSKPAWLITSSGKYYKMSTVTNLTAREGSTKFDLVTKTGVENGLTAVYFYRGPESNITTGIDAPLTPLVEEKLQLISPIREQMEISGCDGASRAYVYSANGSLQAQASVIDGHATVYVGNLPTGIYVVRVGNKSLKFFKK